MVPCLDIENAQGQQQVHGMARGLGLSGCPRGRLGEGCAGRAATEAAGVRGGAERM